MPGGVKTALGDVLGRVLTKFHPNWTILGRDFKGLKTFSDCFAHVLVVFSVLVEGFGDFGARNRNLREISV